jgi:hypothetical protein
MISLLVPTRKRPERLRVMIDSVKRTANVMPQILCYLTPDDESYNWADYAPTQFIVGPRLTMSDLWNALIPYASGDIFMLCADDVIFRTPGWDVEVEKTFQAVPDKILLAFCDDGGPSGKTFSSLPFISRRWVEVVGYFTGPGFSADFSDTWPHDVAHMIGRKRFIPNVLIEHVHWLWGKAPKDQTYLENEQRYVKDRPDARYLATLPQRQADAEKLRRAIAEAFKNDEVENTKAVL